MPTLVSMPDLERQLQALGADLNERTEAVVDGMMQRSRESGATLESMVEDNFAKVGAASTVAVARWMAGEGPEAAREEGMESWRIFGQLAAQIQLGESLSIETFAEGIGYASGLSVLREERCSTGQGFLFAHPLDSEACERFLRASAAEASAEAGAPSASG